MPRFDLARLRDLVQRAATGFSEHDVPRLSAAMSFYAVLSLAPSLVLAIVVAGQFLGERETLAKLTEQARGAVGREGAELILQLVEQARKPGATVIATVLSLLVTFFSASNLFLQLQMSVNGIWGIKEDRPLLRAIVFSRLGAFASAAMFGVLVLGWLVLDSWVLWLIRTGGAGTAWPVASFLVTAAFLTLVFAYSFRSLPRRPVAWRDVWLGAAVSATGVAASKYLLSIYFSFAGVSKAYGSAGALVVILLWIYYTGQIVFFGVELSRASADAREGGSPAP